MGKLRYLFQRVLDIDTARLRRTIAEAARLSGRTRPGIACDMVLCAFRYLAAPADYALFKFYELNAAQRRTYVTRGINDKLVKRYNNPQDRLIFENKDEFNTRFADYLHRDWIRLDTAGAETFAQFIAKHPVFFYKPLARSCGWGIEKIDATGCVDPRSLYNELCARGPGLLEQPIIQHEAMNRLNADSVNTLRLVTINNGERVEVVFAFLRMGNGRVVDNLNSGGMAAPVDRQTGVVTHPAADKDHLAYEQHPASGERIVGFAVPRYAEAVAMVQEAARVVPTVGYVGWDIAVCPDGLCFVEGNSYPGHDILQLPPHVPDKIGLLDNVRAYLS